MKELNRGDIILVNFNPQKDIETGKVRPALIISGNLENKFLDTIIVLPLSSKILKDMKPFRFHLKKRENLKVDSDICLNQIRAITKKRVIEKVAIITKDEYQEIKKLLCENF